MTRFGINGVYNEELSFFGKLAFLIHGNPHIAKFLQSNYFIKNVKRIMSSKIKNVLDVGCGSGDYSFFLTERYPWLEIDSVDINNESIEDALEIKNIKKYQNVSLILSDFQSLEIQKKYDFVFCVEMLHSIKDKLSFLSKISKITKKDGIFYFQDCMKKDYCNMILNDPPKKFDIYRKYFFKGDQLSDEEILEHLTKSNFSIIKKGRMIGFFGQLAWEIDQLFQESSMKYLRTLSIPILKLLCFFGFIFPIGRKNESFIIAKKIK